MLGKSYLDLLALTGFLFVFAAPGQAQIAEPRALITQAIDENSCSAPTAPRCTRSDALSGGSSYPAITVTVNVSPAAPSQLTNAVSVSGGGGNIAGAEDLTIVAPSGAPAALPR